MEVTCPQCGHCFGMEGPKESKEATSDGYLKLKEQYKGLGKATSGIKTSEPKIGKSTVPNVQNALPSYLDPDGDDNYV